MLGALEDKEGLAQVYPVPSWEAWSLSYWPQVRSLSLIQDQRTMAGESVGDRSSIQGRVSPSEEQLVSERGLECSRLD